MLKAIHTNNDINREYLIVSVMEINCKKPTFTESTKENILFRFFFCQRILCAVHSSPQSFQVFGIPNFDHDFDGFYFVWRSVFIPY